MNTRERSRISTTGLCTCNRERRREEPELTERKRQEEDVDDEEEDEEERRRRRERERQREAEEESRIVREFDAIIQKHYDKSENYLRSLEIARQHLMDITNQSNDIKNRYLLGGLIRDRYLLQRKCESSTTIDLRRSIMEFLRNEIHIYRSLRFDSGQLGEHLSLVENNILQSVLQNSMNAADEANLLDLQNCAFKVARVLEDRIIQSTSNYYSNI